jgi:hypothetical protein
MTDLQDAPEDAAACTDAWTKAMLAGQAAAGEDPRFLYDRKLGLGLRLRIRGLVAWVHSVVSEPGAGAGAVDRERHAAALFGREGVTVRRYLALNQDFPLSKDKLEKALAVAAGQAVTIIRSHLGPDAGVRSGRLTPQAVRQLVLHTPYVDPDAYSQYFRDLRRLSAHSRTVDRTLLPEPEGAHAHGFLLTPARQAEVDSLLQLIRSSEPVPSPLIPVYAIGMPPALSELARHLIVQLTQDAHGPDILYLPASSHIPPYRAIDYPTLLTWVDAFLHPALYASSEEPETPLRLASVEVSDARHQIREMVDRVRRTLAVRPIILLVDNVDQAFSQEPELLAAVTGAPVLRLLKQLLYVDADELLIHHSSPTHGLDRSRLVVFVSAEQEVEEFNHITAIRPIKISPPDRDGLVQLAAQFKNKGHVVERIQYGEWRQHALLLRDFLATLDPTSDATQPREFFEALHRRSASWACAVAFLALTDDGLRQGTLCRFLARWSAMTGSLQRMGEAEAAEALSQLRRELPALVAGVAADHPAARVQWAGFDRGPSEQRLFIADVGLKTQLREHLEEIPDCHYTPEERGLMHWLIAEEAILQHTRNLRQSMWQDSESLELQRRLIQGLKHGFKAAAWGFDSQALRHLADRTLPRDPREFFVRLWAIYYRDVVEAPPKYRLARVLQANEVKRDLLRLARGAYAKVSQPGAGHSGLGDDALFSIARDLAVASARAAYDAGDLGEAVALSYDSTSPPHGLRLKVSFAMLDDKWREQVKAAGAWGRDSAAFPPSARGIDVPRADGGVKNCRLSLFKIFVDALLAHGLDDSIQQARSAVDKWLVDELGDEARRVLDAFAKYVRGKLVAPDDGPVVLAQMMKALLGFGTDAGGDGVDDPTGLAAAISQWSAEGKLAGVTDVLLRKAEITAMGMFRQASRRLEEIEGLIDAYILYRLSETLRRALFLRDPLMGSARPSGQPTAVFIRVCFELHGLMMRSDCAAKLLWAPKDYFLDEAGRAVEALTLFSGSLPRERPAVLVLEAVLVRKRTGYWRHALHLLAKADRYLIEGGPNLRIRLGMLAARVETCALALGGQMEGEPMLADPPSDRERGALLTLMRFDEERFRLLHPTSGDQTTLGRVVGLCQRARLAEQAKAAGLASAAGEGPHTSSVVRHPT